MVLIEYTILALLSEKPMTGYDLKKVMIDSCFLYWTGNNNQIYKALIQMVQKGYVSADIVHQDSAPSKKIYTVTSEGRSALEDYVDSAKPELPEFRKPFLVQLSIAAAAAPAQMESLLIQYSQELSAQRVLYLEKQRRKQGHPGRTSPELWLDQLMADNRDRFYQTELEWVEWALSELKNKQSKEESR